MGALGVTLGSKLGVIGGPAYREGLVIVQRPLSLNPLVGADDPAVHDIGHLLYRSLLRLDGSAYPRPDLAQSFAVSTDGLTYTLVLAPGSQWSDGKPVTPADVLATLAFAQSSRAVDHSLAVLLQGVTVSVQRSNIVFTLRTPRGSFAAALTQLPIMPLGELTQQQFNDLAAEPQQAMPTSGEYRVSSADAGTVQLEANPYAPVRPKMDRIEVRLYTSFNDAATAFSHGDVNALLATTPAQRTQLLATVGAVAHPIVTFRFVDLLFNERVAGLDEQVVRQAVNTSVSRSALVHGALSGSGGAIQVDAISEGLPWIAAPDPQEIASPSAAAAALEQAGWKTGPDGIRAKGSQQLAFTVTVPNADPLPAVAAELAGQMKQIGMLLRLQVVPVQSFQSAYLVPHVFSIALGDWDGGPDPDVSAFWRSTAVPPLGYNESGTPTDPFLDQALDSLATLTDPQARAHAAADVSKFLADDLPAVFLYTPEVAYVTRGNVQGMAIANAGGSAARFDSIASWH